MREEREGGSPSPRVPGDQDGADRWTAQQGLTWPLMSETSPRGMRHSGSLACPASSTNTCVKCPTLEPKTKVVTSVSVPAARWPAQEAPTAHQETELPSPLDPTPHACLNRLRGAGGGCTVGSCWAAVVRAVDCCPLQGPGLEPRSLPQKLGDLGQVLFLSVPWFPQGFGRSATG